jgi:hypothetical protein
MSLVNVEMDTENNSREWSKDGRRVSMGVVFVDEPLLEA